MSAERTETSAGASREEKELAGQLTSKVLDEIAEGITAGEHRVEDAIIAGYLRLAATILNRSQVPQP